MHFAPLFSLKKFPLGKYVQWHRPVPGMTPYASKLTHSNPLSSYRTVSAVATNIWKFIFHFLLILKIRWAGHVARMERRGVYKVWWGNLRKRDQLGDPRVGGTITLRYIFRMWDVGVWTGSSWLMMASTCDCGNEPSGSIKCGEFLD